MRKSNIIFIKKYFRFYFISIILSIIAILSLITIEYESFFLKIISLSFSFFIIGISIGSYALISIRDLCLTNSNYAERMNHIGLFIPLILVISFLLKVAINFIFLILKDWFNFETFYFYFFMAFIYFIFNLLGYYLQENNELRKIDLPQSICQLLKRIRIWSFILLFLICKIEKLFWQIIFAVKAYEYYDDTKEGIKELKLHDFSSFIIFFPPIIFGYIHDKYEFEGFKRILYLGCFINILTCSYSFFLMYNEKNIIQDNVIYILSIINEIFRSGNYAMFLPEIIKKFEIKNLLIISGLVSSSIIIIQFLEILLTDYFQKNNNLLLFNEIGILLGFQIFCSFFIIFLLYVRVVNENLGMEKPMKTSNVKVKDINFKIDSEEEDDNIDEQNYINSENKNNIGNIIDNIDENNIKITNKENDNKEQIDDNKSYHLLN